MNKVIKRILLTMFIVLTLITTGFYIWLNQRLKTVINKEIYNSLVDEINLSPALPSQFHKIYIRVIGAETTNEFLFYKTFSILKNKNTSYSCPCINANYGVVTSTLDTWTLGIALDKDASPQKCIDYYLSQFDFLYSIIGIQEASNFYYNKDIEALTNNEMLELSIMTLNPSFYNKYRNSDNLSKKVLEIKVKAIH